MSMAQFFAQDHDSVPEDVIQRPSPSRLDLLDLPVGVLERVAMCRSETWLSDERGVMPFRTFLFWRLRQTSRALAACAWQARHAVLRPTVVSTLAMGDAQWFAAVLPGAGQYELRAALECAVAVSGFRSDTFLRQLLSAGADFDPDDERNVLTEVMLHGDASLLWVFLEEGRFSRYAFMRAFQWAEWSGLEIPEENGHVLDLFQY